MTSQKKGGKGVLLKTIQSEAVPRRCSIKNVFIKILKNSKRNSFEEYTFFS